MALTFGQDLTVAGNIKLTDVDKVSGAYRTIASSSLTASLLTTPQRLEHGQIIYIDSENKLVRVSKITDDSFNTTITFPNFTWPGSGAGGNPAAISGAFAEASGGLATRTTTLETTMTSEQTNIDNLQTVQSSQNIDIINLENNVNQSVKTDASPTFVAVNTGQGANELYEMNQNVKTTDSPTFVNVTSKGNVVVEGMLVAKTFIVSSSVTHMTTSFSSGSTLFGDTIDDTHSFTGSINQSGSFNLNDGDLIVQNNVDIEGNIDINGTANLDNTDIDGTLAVNGTTSTISSTTSSTITSPIISLVGAITGSSHISASGNISTTGTLRADGNVDFNGDLDVDGTTNLDAVDIDGATQIDGTVTVGVDDTGHDVKFFGATTGKSFLYDESGNKVVIVGANGTNALEVADGNVAITDDLDVDGTTNLDATNISLTLDVDGATTLDQVTINTTDGEFKVEGGNQVNIDSNIDIDNATTAIDTTTSTIITSPIINLVGPVTASGNISGSVTSTGSFGRIKFAGNLSGSYHSTASFGRLEVNANTISIGGTEIKKSVADNITTLDTPLSTTSEPQFAGLKLTSTASISEFTGSSFNFNATNAANLLSVYDESNALVMKVGKGLMVLGAQATAPAPEAGGFFYSGSGNPGEDDFYLGFE